MYVGFNICYLDFGLPLFVYFNTPIAEFYVLNQNLVGVVGLR